MYNYCILLLLLDKAEPIIGDLIKQNYNTKTSSSCVQVTSKSRILSLIVTIMISGMKRSYAVVVVVLGGFISKHL